MEHVSAPEIGKMGSSKRQIQKFCAGNQMPDGHGLAGYG